MCTYPCGPWAIVILNESEMTHEILDLYVLGGKVVESTFGLAGSEGSYVGIFHVVTHGVANGINPLDLASEHLSKFVGLRISKSQLKSTPNR